MNLSCSCGAKFCSCGAEAKHRHNFPHLCKQNKKATDRMIGNFFLKLLLTAGQQCASDGDTRGDRNETG